MQIGTQKFALVGAEKQHDGAASASSHGAYGDQQGANSDSFASAMQRPPKPHATNDGGRHSGADRQGVVRHEAQGTEDRYGAHGQRAGFRNSLLSEEGQSTVPLSAAIGEAIQDGAQLTDLAKEAGAAQLTTEELFPGDSKALALMVQEISGETAPTIEDPEASGLAKGSEHVGPLEKGSGSAMLGGGLTSADKGLITTGQARASHAAAAGQDVNQKVQANPSSPQTGSEVQSALGSGQDPNQPPVSRIAAASPDTRTLTASQTLGQARDAALGMAPGSTFDKPAQSGEVKALDSTQSTRADPNARVAFLGLERSIMGEKAGDSTTHAEEAGAGATARTVNSGGEVLKPGTAKDRPEPVDVDVPGEVQSSDRSDAAVARRNTSRTDPAHLTQPPFPLVSEMANLIEGDRELFADVTADLVVGEARGAETLTARAEISGHLRTELPRHIAMQLADVARTMPDRPVELTLSPEELGRLRLTFSGDLSAMTVTVNVERPETLELMRRHIDTLAREMQEIGYEEVSFSFEHSGSEHGEGDTSTDTANADNKSAGGTASDSAELEQLDPVRLQIETGPGLDIRL